MSSRFHVNDATTLADLATILAELGASIAVDLTGRHVIVTLTCPLSASAASGDTLPEAIDRAIGRLEEARRLQARERLGALLLSKPPVHPTMIRCSLCGAFAAHELAHAREIELRAAREGRPFERVDPAFVVRTDPTPGSYRVMMCNTLVTGPMRVVDGREYHEVRVIAAERASAKMTGTEPAAVS